MYFWHESYYILFECTSLYIYVSWWLKKKTIYLESWDSRYFNRIFLFFTIIIISGSPRMFFSDFIVSMGVIRLYINHLNIWYILKKIILFYLLIFTFILYDIQLQFTVDMNMSDLIIDYISRENLVFSFKRYNYTFYLGLKMYTFIYKPFVVYCVVDSMIGLFFIYM